jgi:hypothetical protein
MSNFVLTQQNVFQILAVLFGFCILSGLGGWIVAKWFGMNRHTSDDAKESGAAVDRRQADLTAAGREKFKDDPEALDMYQRLEQNFH